MNFKLETFKGLKIGTALSQECCIHNEEDALNAVGDWYYSELDVILIYETNLNPLFFDLKTGLMGSFFQKISG